MSKLKPFDYVLVTAPGHRKNGKTGQVVSGPGKFIGTYLVTVDGDNYGFMPHELTKLVPEEDS